MENRIPWMYRGLEITPADVPEGSVGFCYLVYDYTYDMIYIGKKQLTSTNRKKIGVREKKSTKTRKTFKVTVKDSDWMNYNTSCKPLQERLKTAKKGEIRKEILEFAYSKKNLSWLELKHQVLKEVLTRGKSYNECIAGRYWARDCIKEIYDKDKERKSAK